MFKHIKDLWIVDLETNPPKTEGKLQRGQPYSDYTGEVIKPGFCCLGRLCEIAVNNGVIEPPSFLLEYPIYGRAAESSYLPKEVQEWAGMISDRGIINGEPQKSLAIVNDSSETWEPVIKFIEENWEQL